MKTTKKDMTVCRVFFFNYLYTDIKHFIYKYRLHIRDHQKWLLSLFYLYNILLVKFKLQIYYIIIWQQVIFHQ
jgi:hypothetical protein